MSSRVRYAIVALVLAGIHWSYRPFAKAFWPPAQSWLRPWRNSMPRRALSGRNGSVTLEPSDWFQTDLPLGSVTGRGSPKPRTPFIAPK